MLSAWAEAGFEPDAFWRQTPASFEAVMDGVRRKHKRDMENDLWRAYSNAALGAAASAGKLKSFAHYKRQLEPRKVAQTPQEMLEVFRSLQSSGAPMTIRQIERKAD